jgi:hypothetical protein
MYRHCAIKSDVLPRYEFPKFSEGDVSQPTLSNKAFSERQSENMKNAPFSRKIGTFR